MKFSPQVLEAVWHNQCMKGGLWSVTWRIPSDTGTIWCPFATKLTNHYNEPDTVIHHWNHECRGVHNKFIITPTEN